MGVKVILISEIGNDAATIAGQVNDANLPKVVAATEKITNEHPSKVVKHGGNFTAKTDNYLVDFVNKGDISL